MSWEKLTPAMRSLFDLDASQDADKALGSEEFIKPQSPPVETQGGCRNCHKSYHEKESTAHAGANLFFCSRECEDAWIGSKGL
jgi:hypothetical protein